MLAMLIFATLLGGVAVSIFHDCRARRLAKSLIPGGRRELMKALPGMSETRLSPNP